MSTTWMCCLCCLQGAVGFGEPQPLVPYAYESRGWLWAVQVGNMEYGSSPNYLALLYVQ
jgi:hypothetical protein